ncbi:hypothetical protein, partial [Pectobacterium atrosepticum]|uniref:hypothetical protein n=1 Tax=Pectobacterium atrosepticum TaxID=29471 RepID=UPI00191EF42D
MGALRSSSAMACGWPPGLCSSEQRGAQGCALCCEHRARSSASTVWPPSLAAQASALVFSKHQRQQNKGCRPAASAEGLYARPAASGCAGSQSAGSLLLPRSPASAPRPGV